MRVFLGSVSRKVLDHAGCPVLIARLPDQREAADESRVVKFPDPLSFSHFTRGEIRKGLRT